MDTISSISLVDTIVKADKLTIIKNIKSIIQNDTVAYLRAPVLAATLAKASTWQFPSTPTWAGT